MKQQLLKRIEALGKKRIKAMLHYYTALDSVYAIRCAHPEIKDLHELDRREVKLRRALVQIRKRKESVPLKEV